MRIVISHTWTTVRSASCSCTHGRSDGRGHKTGTQTAREGRDGGGTTGGLSPLSCLLVWLTFSTTMQPAHTHTHTSHIKTRRPWRHSQRQWWVFFGDVSGQHCMSCPVFFSVCSHKSQLLLDQPRSPFTTLFYVCVCLAVWDRLFHIDSTSAAAFWRSFIISVLRVWFFFFTLRSHADGSQVKRTSTSAHLLAKRPAARLQRQWWGERGSSPHLPRS